MPGICDAHWLGAIDYQAAWELQARLAGEIAAGMRPPTLLLLEHPHTYTFGRTGHLENLLWDEAELSRRGVQVHWVDRGGDITYHGPGQLVGYPLLPLAPGGLNAEARDPARPAHLPRADFVGYLRRLEQALILALAQLGIAAVQVPGLTGVWVRPGISGRIHAPEQHQNPAKIAAIGVKVDARGISRHGFALNVNPDMEFWQGIIGCGLADHRVTSLVEWMDPPPSMEQVTAAVVSAFGETFDFVMKQSDNLFDREPK